MEEKETRQETPTERPSYRVEKDWYIRPVDRKRERRKAALYILVASLFYTVGFHYFVGAARFAPGGVGGVVAMVQYSIGIAGTGGGVDFRWSFGHTGVFPVGLPSARFSRPR